MPNRELDNRIHHTKLELLASGFDIHNLHIYLQPGGVIVVKPLQYLQGEEWNRLATTMRGLGFSWFRNDRAWKRKMIQ